ncbi:MAG: imidazole glycerol phosphate synthase subunit HisH [Gemmatimonadetes bacterium]|jgi:glutamine amidotransferase|nr:imidazole glycerol phosphate synthase subunit HisH [Gemmatimonadota bacterium]
MRVTIFDYGAGNLHSLAKAIEGGGVEVRIEEDPTRAIETDALVLPGVGAFGAAAGRLAPGRDAMREAIVGGLPTLGICLGMQLLFEGSDEGEGAGLGVVAGRVSRLEAQRVPQIGWNALEAQRDPLFDAAPLSIAYYANSFVCRPTEPTGVIAWSEHEADRFPAAVRAGAAVGAQFHPEKSSTAGVRWLRAFLDEARTSRRPR